MVILILALLTSNTRARCPMAGLHHEDGNDDEGGHQLIDDDPIMFNHAADKHHRILMMANADKSSVNYEAVKKDILALLTDSKVRFEYITKIYMYKSFCSII